tara:strand:+ start:3518 stop:4579 length:1062 start_codon:yes stop_codon:yes gene_type:complete
MRKLAIIGGGFYGCYIAKKLKDKFKSKVEIHIFEKNKKLIQEAGKNNQYKLHLGYHYPRSSYTIKQTINGSKKFKKEFDKFIFYPKKNIYLIHKKSKVKADKFYKIFKKHKLRIKHFDIKKIKFIKNYNDFERAFKTEEGVINFDKLNSFLIKKIRLSCRIYKNKNIKEINSSQGFLIDSKNNIYSNYDHIINCSYTNPNMGLKKKFNLKYELAGMVKIKNPFKQQIGITIMDGKFVTLYPRDKYFSSLSSVTYTPIKKFTNLNSLYKFQKRFKLNNNNRIVLIKKDIRKYFNQNLKIKNSLLITAPKTKIYNDAKDQRPSLIKRNKKTFSILAGKIDVAPIIYEKLLKKMDI